MALFGGRWPTFALILLCSIGAAALMTWLDGRQSVWAFAGWVVFFVAIQPWFLLSSRGGGFECHLFRGK